MTLQDRFEINNPPFEGDRTLLLRSIPANAKITRATVTATPIDITEGQDPFAEIIAFNGNRGDLGATKTRVASVAGTPVVPGWVEIDFHARRTLARVRGTGLTGTTLQADLGGGAYIEINDKGAFLTPDDEDSFELSGNDAPLPGLIVTKLKITGAGSNLNPDIDQITIRSVPANVTLRLGRQSPFFLSLGDLTETDTSSDFADVLQAFLTEAEIENGFYRVPLMLHSDTIGRLDLTFAIEHTQEQSLLPSGLSEVTLPFDFNTVPQAEAGVLQVTLPANARVVARGTTARVIGAFDETRIVFGPTGSVTPAAAVPIAPGVSQAQLIALESATPALAVDLLVHAVSRIARLKLDLRDDFDGKPDGETLLPEAIQFDLDRETTGRPTWISVPLLTEFQFQPKTNRRYWLVLHSLEGEAAWNVVTAPAGVVGMQRTQDGGLSWRETTASNLSGPLAAFFRLRHRPARFQIPIELQVGEGEHAQRVRLDRFQPLGRVDFTLDFPEVAEAFNRFLAEETANRCPESEHLLNGDFEQWVRLGNNLGQVSSIELFAVPRAVAVAPDGAFAYVLSQGTEIILQVIDVLCNQLRDDELVIDGASPEALLAGSDGTRVYVLTDSGDLLHVIDVDNFRELGSTQLLAEANAWVLSPDSRVLYVSEYIDANGDGVFETKVVRALDTAKLEQLVLGQLSSLDDATIGDVSLTPEQQPTAFAVSPNGRELYAVIPGAGTNAGNIYIIDTTTFTLVDTPIEVDQTPSAIAVTPDGRMAMIANKGSNSVSVIDLTRRATVGSSIIVVEGPISVAISPDGERAFVANSGVTEVSVIDIEAHRVIETISTLSAGGNPLEVAITPQGDRVYILPSNPDFTSIEVIPIGEQLPAEWALTSGQVAPLCLSDPFHVVTFLGPMPFAPIVPVPSALSQIVPVAASCLYEFSFFGFCLPSDALAEVLWLGGNCGLLRVDQIPIATLVSPATKTFPTRGNQFLAFSRAAQQVGTREPQLILHQARLVAPEGATQAEIRFSAPEGVKAAVDKVSLQATTDALTNGDLSLLQNMLPRGWTLSPQPAPGFSLFIGDDHRLRLRNAGANAVALGQIVAAQADQAFALELQGLSLPQGQNQSTPRIELLWLDAEGAATGSPASLEILSTGSDLHTLSGAVPAAAAQVEIRIVLPPRTALAVTQVSFRVSEPVVIPVSFLAQAPGQLTLSDFRVAFESIDSPPPRVPEQGLCTPTPPGRAPGETPHDCCFCPCCESEREMLNSEPMVTEAGRPAQVGDCPDCGTQLLRHGGQLVHNASRLALPLTPISQRTFQAPIRQTPLPSKTVSPAKEAEKRPISLISGLGKRRTERLAEAGIDSVEKLAVTSPESLTRVLKGISAEKAAQIIAQAGQIISSQE